MHKYQIYYILIFICLISCKTSKVIENPIYPIKGEIVYEKKDTIYDANLYNTSFSKFESRFGEALKKQVIKEREEYNEPIDTVLLNQMIEMSKQNLQPMLSMLSAKDGKLYYKFKDSVIIGYNELNGKISSHYKVINRNKNTYYQLSKIDSSSIKHKTKPYNYQNETNITVKEYRNDIKTINNFKCFKVIFEVPENMDNTDKQFSELFKDAKKIYTLYVTDYIKSKYHPVINYKIILDKYFPLEITEKNNYIKGTETKYELIKISLK